MDTRALAEREVVELHEFFVDWFNGSCPGDDATYEARFASHLSPELHYRMPGGEAFTRDQLLAALKPAHGKNPDFRIKVRNVAVRFEDEHCVLATYEELQRGAKSSDRSDSIRCTTVLFLRDGNHLRWHHIHECWLLKTEQEAGPNF